ncbi:hypothetical protein AB0I28_08545 [Phytomonospora sp. NPDC050363]|uniref:hypothetical protein n=1 Tax=Phytomonospora sp. NPDC050363 TaxID=3155642 RepID=UPI00340FA50F
MLREVHPRAALTPGHRVDMVRHLHGRGWALASYDGTVTLTDAELALESRLDLGMTLTDLEFAADGTWAWIGESGLWTGTPGEPRPGPENAGSVRWADDDLWIAWEDDGLAAQIAVELCDREYKTLAATTVPELYGGSGVWFHPHPDPGAVVMWVAGPAWAGSESYVITREGGALRAQPVPFERGGPAVFADGGLLIAVPDLVRASWPDCAELGRLPWTDISPDPHDERPTRDLCPLPGGKAAWGSSSRRVRVVDLDTMTVEAEVVLDGHPVRTFSAFYAAPGIGSPHGDLTHFTCGGGDVVSVHSDQEVLLSAAADWAGA